MLSVTVSVCPSTLWQVESTPGGILLQKTLSHPPERTRFKGVSAAEERPVVSPHVNLGLYTIIVRFMG